jgi:hypothetical protein
VISKEFAAAPLWIYALLSALRRRWETALHAALGAVTATLVWFALQTALMTLYNYSYGNNPSVNLLTGAYFAVWTDALGWPRALASLFMAFGPLFVLLPAGWLRADRSLRLLAIASLPALAAFVYVQQPDRALWNFHFVVIPDGDAGARGAARSAGLAVRDRVRHRQSEARRQPAHGCRVASGLC